MTHDQTIENETEEFDGEEMGWVKCFSTIPAVSIKAVPMMKTE